MSANTDTVKKLYEAFTTGNLDTLDQFVAADVIENSPDPTVQSSNKGIEYLKDIIRTYRQSSPDMKVDVRKTVEEGDTVVTLFKVTGTNTGSVNGQPATNKRFEADGMDMIRFKDGKMVEHWGVFDTASMLAQLGLLPQPEAVAAGGNGQAAVTA
jgi:steroid delta-isomerase-like uncharacterized protein